MRSSRILLGFFLEKHQYSSSYGLPEKNLKLHLRIIKCRFLLCYLVYYKIINNTVYIPDVNLQSISVI